MTTMLTSNLELTTGQKTRILELINRNSDAPPALKELTRIAFGEGFDGRSPQGRAVKEYLATLCIKAGANGPKHVELTPENQLYIRNNFSTMSITEMARALFNKDVVMRNMAEYKVVESFLISINEKAYDPSLIIPRNEPFIPKTLDQAARLVNRCVFNAIDMKTLKKDTRIQNNLQTLVRYCHKMRYGMILSTLTEEKEIELFEHTFISNVWDKSDLSEEEIDTNINLACDVVNYTKMQKDIEKLREMRDKCLDDSEGKRLSMSLVQQIGELYKEMDNNFKRQNATTKALIGTRNERMEGRMKENASVSQLVEAWRDQQKRERMRAVAEKRKQLIRDEINRLDTLDTLKVEIFGLNRESFFD